MQQAKYSYIEWLPENRIVLATAQSLLEDKYITGLVGKNVFAYSRDDNPNFALPSISVDTGEIYAADPFNRIEGEIVINVYYGLELIAAKTTEIIQTTMATIRSRVQNLNFIQSVIYNMVKYNEIKSRMQHPFDAETFKKAMEQYAWLMRYGFALRSSPATAKTLSNKTSCYKSTLVFKYWVEQTFYRQFLETVGISDLIDPNKVIYNRWETFDINIEEIKDVF